MDQKGAQAATQFSSPPSPTVGKLELVFGYLKSNILMKEVFIAIDFSRPDAGLQDVLLAIIKTIKIRKENVVNLKVNFPLSKVCSP